MSENKPNNNNNKKKPIRINLTWLYLIIGAFLIGITFWDKTGDTKQVAYNQFKQYVEKGYISKIVIVNKEIAEATINEKDSIAFIEIYDRDLGVAFQTHPGRQASISSGSKEPRSALESRRVSLGAHWVD